MCDPVTIGLSMLGGLAAKSLAPKPPEMQAPAPVAAPAPLAAPTPPEAVAAAVAVDPAAERAKAETEAANAANTKLASDKQARRANVLAGGGSSDTLGKAQSVIAGTGKTSVLGGGAT